MWTAMGDLPTSTPIGGVVGLAARCLSYRQVTAQAETEAEKGKAQQTASGDAEKFGSLE
jgi:hypothetical protein